MNASGSSAPSRSPTTSLDGSSRGRRALPAGDVRLVPRENLHVTLAFLGSRPGASWSAIGARAGEAAAAARRRSCCATRGYRETRSVGMLVFDDEGGAAGALAADLHARLERLGVYEPERRPWLPHVTVVRFRERPRLEPPLPELGEVESVRSRCLPIPCCGPTGAQYVVVQEFGLARRLGG